MEPISLGIVTALVTLMTAYMQYKVEMEKAQNEGTSEPEKTEEITQGEQVAEMIEAGVATHGTKAEQSDLENWKEDPQSERRQRNLSESIQDITRREPAFGQQLQQFQQQKGIQSGSVHGEVKAYSQAKIDQAAGVNVGTMTYTPGKKDD